MRLPKAIAVGALLTLCLVAPAVSTEPAAEAPGATLETMKQATRAAGAARGETPTAIPEAPGDVVLSDVRTRQAYLAAMQRFYEYRADGYAYRSRVFEWQLVSSKVIFAVVLLLVLAGVYFAAVQFHVALRLVRRPPRGTTGEGEATEGADLLHAEVEISAKGIAVKSSVLGVVVLALSLAFYYLYLVYVYPIQNVL